MFFLNKNWIYSNIFRYDFADAFIRIYKITELKDEKLFFQLKIGLNRIDLTQFFPMKPSECKISLSVKSFYKNKTAENC